jgi:diadenosine tetraphosphate (Ap4A) HIT family hydrolase
LGGDPLATGIHQVTTSFNLDPRLKADTIFVKSLGLSELLIFNDARYPWAILVPRIVGAVELHELSAENYTQVCAEIASVARVIGAFEGVTKVNIGALGNVVSQLHIHLVGRHEGDPAWPGPVWGHSPRVGYADGGEDALFNALGQVGD